MLAIYSWCGGVSQLQTVCPLWSGEGGGTSGSWWALLSVTIVPVPFWPRAAPLNPKQGACIQTHICTKPGQWPLARSFNTLLALTWAHNIMKSSSPKVEIQWQRWWPDWHMDPVSSYVASVSFWGQDQTKLGAQLSAHQQMLHFKLD